MNSKSLTAVTCVERAAHSHPMVKIIGAKSHSARLKRLSSPAMIRKVGSALFAGGQAIQVEAQLSITRGAVSGRGHVPSSPGQPPNQDTGVLANNIETTLEAPLRVHVSSNAPYSAPLEFGTSKMAARPFMQPAVAAKRKEVTQLVRQAVDSVTRKGA